MGQSDWEGCARTASHAHRDAARAVALATSPRTVPMHGTAPCPRPSPCAGAVPAGLCSPVAREQPSTLRTRSIQTLSMLAFVTIFCSRSLLRMPPAPPPTPTQTRHSLSIPAHVTPLSRTNAAISTTRRRPAEPHGSRRRPSAFPPTASRIATSRRTRTARAWTRIAASASPHAPPHCQPASHAPLRAASPVDPRPVG